jgi:alkylated DNA repair dioxygenase AlkB
VVNPTIAIVAVGSRPPLRLRPNTGGRSLSIDHGAGDLLVMGGACQHRWQHTVPKSRHAGPRISITYRHSGNH